MLLHWACLPPGPMTPAEEWVGLLPRLLYCLVVMALHSRCRFEFPLARKDLELKFPISWMSGELLSYWTQSGPTTDHVETRVTVDIVIHTELGVYLCMC